MKETKDALSFGNRFDDVNGKTRRRRKKRISLCRKRECHVTLIFRLDGGQTTGRGVNVGLSEWNWRELRMCKVGILKNF